VSEEDINVYEAKKSLKTHIKFFDVLLKHLDGENEEIKRSTMWATYCLHRYINDRLLVDINRAVREYETNTKQ
jgi:hypothetical protein